MTERPRSATGACIGEVSLPETSEAYLFTGSPEAAKRLAGAYTLVQSCRAVGVQPRAYLIDVIAKLEVDWPLRRIGELVSDQWAVLHGPGALGQQTTE